MTKGNPVFIGSRSKQVRRVLDQISLQPPGRASGQPALRSTIARFATRSQWSALIVDTLLIHWAEQNHEAIRASRREFDAGGG